MAYDDDELDGLDGDELDEFSGDGDYKRRYNYDENDYEYDSGDDEEGYENDY